MTTDHSSERPNTLNSKPVEVGDRILITAQQTGAWKQDPNLPARTFWAVITRFTATKIIATYEQGADQKHVNIYKETGAVQGGWGMRAYYNEQALEVAQATLRCTHLLEELRQKRLPALRAASNHQQALSSLTYLEDTLETLISALEETQKENP